MARGSKSGENTVSLFPFLAVLVCVMGSLIFLLLATTKRMHDLAVAEAEARLHPPQATTDVESPPVEMPAPELGTPIAPAADPLPSPEAAAADLARQQSEAELRDKIAALERRRGELTDALRRQRASHQAARKKVAALEASVAESQTRLRGLLAEVDEEKEQRASAPDLEALEAQIIELRRKLRMLQNRPTEGQTKFAVVPFDARSGTTRRPILIECTDHGLRFMPENVVIRPSDLEGFSERYNPLLAGATALLRYWTEWNQRQEHPDEEPEPYILLIVRPEGTIGYYIAMRMLGSLRQPFGYELVDDAVELAPPPVDPLAQKLCREAVERQLQDREDLAHQVHSGFRTSNVKGGIRGASRTGSTDTFDVADVLPKEEGVGDRSWEHIDRFQGRRPKSAISPGGTGASDRNGAKIAGEPRFTGSGREARNEADSHGELRPSKAGSAARPASNAGGKYALPRGSPESKSGDDEGFTPPVRKIAEADADGSSGDPSTEPRELKPAERSDAAANSAGKPNSKADSNAKSLLPPTGARRGRAPGMSPPPRGPRGSGSAFGSEEPRIEQLARRHWGQSEPNATIGIEQDVTVRVDGQQLIVADDRVVQYQPGEQSLNLFLRLMEAVDAESQTWGKARPGFYWTPRLRFVISPGGNQLFERLDPWAAKSGLSSTKEFTLDGVTPIKSEAPR